jgi:hypothetical protein
MRDRYTSGVHGHNMRCSCAFYPTHWHGVPRIFLTAPLSYAAETYAMPKVSSFRATENSQPVQWKDGFDHARHERTLGAVGWARLLGAGAGRHTRRAPAPSIPSTPSSAR